jgi:hypothetical protein
VDEERSGSKKGLKIPKSGYPWGRGSYSVGARCNGIGGGGVQQGMSPWREGTSSEQGRGEGSRDEGTEVDAVPNGRDRSHGPRIRICR